jgi:hypothetical protein
MSSAQTEIQPPKIGKRIDSYDWRSIENSIDQRGFARLPALLTGRECDELMALYPDRKRFRSFIEMGPRRFGEGSYRYFGYPLPAGIRSLRSNLYRRLAPIANRWHRDLRLGKPFPRTLRDFTSHCHREGQLRPTPLLLHYREGGFNCLHQDVYGKIAFPLQVACLLSRSSSAEEPQFSGGEFILSEQRPRQQTRVEALALETGEGLIFANQYRPISGKNGAYRAHIKHGVSRIHWGERFTLGVIFHDAE